MIVCISDQGAKVSKNGRHLIVTGRNGDKVIFTNDLEQLLVFGNVQLTPQAIYLLLKQNIDTVFIRMDGRYMGRLSGNESANALLRKKQFLLTDSEQFCLHIAKSIIFGKLSNQAGLMSRIGREHGLNIAKNAAVNIKELAWKAQKAENMESLRGFEGAGAAIYFQAFSEGLNHEWEFSGRSRRPPADPVNAVLSLLYTLLVHRCHAAIKIAGLDPAPACLHTLDYGQNSLALDLVEEFRPVIADSLALSLFNLSILKKNDFETLEVSEELSDLENTDFADISEIGQGNKLAVKLKEDAFKKVLARFLKKMETEFYNQLAEKQMSYFHALLFQARQYRRLIEGELENYTPLLLH